MSVYFVTCREANAVKIGSSLEPHARLPEIQWGCPLPLTLEAVRPGGNSEQEFELHRRFADDRIRGEWFRITPMIEAIMAASPVSSQTNAADQQKSGRAPSHLRRDRKRYAAAMTETQAEREASAIRREMA
jgi:hypothetical protein